MSRQSMDLHDKFLFTLDWLLEVTRRYAFPVQFDLVHVNFANPAVLGNTFGAQEAAGKLDTILDTLRTAFRKADLVTRDGVDFWLLVPDMPADGKHADRIQAIIEAASHCGLQIVERDISFFSLPLEVPTMNPDCSAADFLAYLKKNQPRLAKRTIRMAPEPAVP